MKEDVIVEGLPDSPFYTSDKAREATSQAMQEAVSLMTKKGQRQCKLPDGSLVDELPKEERDEWYGAEEARILMRVRYLDPNFVDSIIPEDY